MSKMLLVGACANCPMRKKIDCDIAEVQKTVTHSTAPQSEWESPRLLYISYELTDILDDPDAQRIELRTLQSKEYFDKARAAADAVKERAGYHNLSRQSIFEGSASGLRARIEESMERIGIESAALKAKQASLRASLAESITNCDGPERQEGGVFWRRKQCDADIVGRIIPRRVMSRRNFEAAVLKRHGAMWTTPETLGKFKPIR